MLKNCLKILAQTYRTIVLKKALTIVRNAGYTVIIPNDVWDTEEDTHTIIYGTLEEYNIGDPYYHSPLSYGVVDDVTYNSDGTRNVRIKLA